MEYFIPLILIAVSILWYNRYDWIKMKFPVISRMQHWIYQFIDPNATSSLSLKWTFITLIVSSSPFWMAYFSALAVDESDLIVDMMKDDLYSGNMLFVALAIASSAYLDLTFSHKKIQTKLSSRYWGQTNFFFIAIVSFTVIYYTVRKVCYYKNYPENEAFLILVIILTIFSMYFGFKVKANILESEKRLLTS